MLRRWAAIEAAALASAPSAEEAPVTAAVPEALLRRIGEANAEASLPELEGVRPSDFTIQYQPVFDVRAETLVGVEALLRWEIAPGNVLTQESLDPAPRSLLFDRVGLMAIRHTTDELAPLIGTKLTVAVTANQLGNAEFAEKTLGTLGATGFPARRLLLALDSTQMPALETITEAVATLRQAGVQIVLDRFVLTPAILPAVSRTHFDGVRLDPRLTRQLDENGGRLRLATAAIETARAEGLSIIAPGVDRREDLAPLVRMGCTQFQGALFASPMAVRNLTQLLLAAPIRRAS